MSYPFKIDVHSCPPESAGSSSSRSGESFEEWSERVSALDRAVRKHLEPTGQDNWRLIDVDKMLSDWKLQRSTSSYLNLTERFIRILPPFATSGTLSPRVVVALLSGCESFLTAHDFPSFAEEGLARLARESREWVVSNHGKFLDRRLSA